MSILTGSEIKRLVKNGDIVISPFNEEQLNPNSYNVRLHNTLKVYKDPVLDLKADNPTEDIIIPAKGLVLIPGKLYLGRTVEYTETKIYTHKVYNPLIGCENEPLMVDKEKALVIAIDGRSSLARLGVSCHIAAGYGDIGFCGTFTCEISCVQPVRIYPDILIGQIYYTTTVGKFDKVYNGKYQNQIDATESRFYIDADK